MLGKLCYRYSRKARVEFFADDLNSYLFKELYKDLEKHFSKNKKDKPILTVLQALKKDHYLWTLIIMISFRD